MIKVYFSPQVSDRQIEYSFNGETLTAKIGDTEDIFDFSSLPDGELDREQEIETILPVNPIVSAKRVDGVLHLELLNWIEPDAPYESRFPEWCELPLPEGITKEKPKRTAVISWRTQAEIDAEQEATIAAKQEREERRARIQAALNSDLLETGEADLRSILQDIVEETGILD